MARARNPKRDEAFQIFLDSKGKIKLKDIAEQIGVPDLRVRKWKSEDKWDEKIRGCSDLDKGTFPLDNRNVPIEKKKPGGQQGNKNAKGHGAPPGNKNGLGNKGGPPPRNTNAVKTGEHQTIWLDYLDEAERAFYDGIDTDEDIQTNVTLRNLTFRENLMMKRLFELQEGVDNVETNTVQERVSQTVPMEVYDESAGEIRIKSTTVSKMQIREITEKKKSMLGEILRIEEALTRIQDKKAKLLQLKHKLGIDQEKLKFEKRRIDILESKTDIDIMRSKIETENGGAGSGLSVNIIDDIPEVDDGYQP